MPAEHVGLILRDARSAGSAFEVAWPSAVAAAVAGLSDSEREDWGAALNSTRDDWELAWERRSPARAQRALLAVAVDGERVALEPGDNGLAYCARCDAPIATASGQCGPRATYCGATCRKLASASRLAA